jgi:hypothetical protein
VTVKGGGGVQSPARGVPKWEKVKKRMAIDSNGDYYKPGMCFECRAGEHEDIDDKIEMCKIINPDTGKMFKRGYLCSAHQDIFISDGYILK